MKKNLNRFLGLLMAIMMVLPMFSFAAAEELTTITIYPKNGDLLSGVLDGYKGRFFAEHGLRIEVWAYSDDKTNAILASGDLPDIMYLNDTILPTMIQAEMLLPLDEHLEKMPNVMARENLVPALNYAREYKSNDTGKLWYMPVNVGVADGSGDETERYAIRLNWEFYEGIGAPEVTNIWDLIPVVKQMLEAYPEGNPDGSNKSKNYGTVLNSGSDTTYWGNIQMPFYWSGYQVTELPYMLEADMIEGTYTSILNTESKYYESLKWYNAMYREGLIDPDSINLDRPTQKAKVDGGNVMLPTGTNPGWRPTYYQILLDDTRSYYPDYSTYGAVGIGINAKTDKLDACLKFLDLIANADNYMPFRQGPEGWKWEFDENGNVVLTDAFIETIKAGTTMGPMADGEEFMLWNTPWITHYGEPTTLTDPKGNPIPCNINGWKEYQEISGTNPTYLKWKDRVGYATYNEWAASQGKYFNTSPIQDVSSFTSQPDDMTKLVMDALRDVVVTASWQMVYAETDEAFQAIWDQMVADCEGLGAQDIIDWRLEDLAAAKAKQDALAGN